MEIWLFEFCSTLLVRCLAGLFCVCVCVCERERERERERETETDRERQTEEVNRYTLYYVQYHLN